MEEVEDEERGRESRFGLCERSAVERGEQGREERTWEMGRRGVAMAAFRSTME